MVSPRRLSYVRLEMIRGAERNPRRHDIPAIAQLIALHGFLDPPEIDSRTDQLLGGHGRVAALVHLRGAGAPTPDGLLVDDDGEWLVPVIEGWTSRDRSQAEAAATGLNRASELGSWDQRGLVELLEDIQATDPMAFAALDYDPEELDKLLRFTDQEQPTPGTGGDPDEEDEDADDQPRYGEVSCPACGHVFVPAS